MDINGISSTNYYETLAKKNNYVTYDGENCKFDRELMKKQCETSNSFVTPLTKEDIYQIWDEKIKANADKKMTTREMLAAHPFAKEMMYSMVGSSKLMTFDEYVREIENRIRAEQEK